MPDYTTWDDSDLLEEFFRRNGYEASALWDEDPEGNRFIDLVVKKDGRQVYECWDLVPDDIAVWLQEHDT